MSDKTGEFIANLINNLSKNGFPEKKVALPLEALYESAHNKGVNFNKVLTFLSEEKEIAHEKTPTKIIFFQKQTEQAFSNMDDLIRLGQQMFGDAKTPEDIKSG